jgi:hypothetical protein
MDDGGLKTGTYKESTLEYHIYTTLLCMEGMDLQIFQGFFSSFYAFALGLKEFKGWGGLIGDYTKRVYKKGGGVSFRSPLLSFCPDSQKK